MSRRLKFSPLASLLVVVLVIGLGMIAVGSALGAEEDGSGQPGELKIPEIDEDGHSGGGNPLDDDGLQADPDSFSIDSWSRWGVVRIQDEIPGVPYFGTFAKLAFHVWAWSSDLQKTWFDGK